MTPEEAGAAYTAQGQGTMDSILEAYVPQVEHMARHIAELYNLADDQELISAGYEALWEALRKYDPARSDLPRYLMGTVRLRLLDVVRREMPLDTRLWAKVQEFRKVLAALTADLGRYPTDPEILAHTQWTSSRLSAMYEAENRLLGPVAYEDALAGRAEDALDAEQSLLVKEALALLPEREQKILYALYVGGYTPAEVAEAWNLEVSWVRRLRGRALASLRAHLSDTHFEGE